MILIIVIAVGMVVCVGGWWLLLYMLRRYGKDAVAGRKSIGWVKGKDWRW